MASVHRMRRSPFWYAAFYLPDGRRALRSTGCRDRKQALKIAIEWDAAARDGREGRLTELRTRETMAAIFKAATGRALPCATLGAFLDAWLERKRGQVADSSLEAYAGIVRTLREHFGRKIDRPMDAVSRADVLTFRTALAARVAPATVNKTLAICRMIWADAIEDSICRENPFAGKKILLKSKAAGRRAFTADEIRRILEVCSPEWQGMVYAGLYTGQRLGDVAAITWRAIDLEHKTLSIVTRKTGRPITLPIAEPLFKHIMAAPAADDPDAPLFPTLAPLGSGHLSRLFNEILQAAGLVEKRDHKAAANGRSTRRRTGGLSFHCLRHTATSWLKNAGVSDVIAREIIGHESEAISRVYTHIEGKTLKEALAKMPDIG